MIPQIAYLLNLSIQQIQSGRLEDAERSLKQVIQIHPKNADALCFLSVISAYKLQWQDALDLIDKSLEFAPNNSVAHSNKGNILKELGDTNRAIKSYEKAITLDSKNPEAYNNLGNLQQDLEEYSNSIISYDKAIHLKPDYAEAYSNKANALFKLGRDKDALDFYSRAIEINPYYHEAWLHRSIVMKNLKLLDEALFNCDQAISINPKSEKSWLLKGELFLQVNLYKEAITFFDKALELKSNLAEAWSEKAKAYSGLKDLEQSKLCFEKAYLINPELDYLLGNMIHAKMLVGDWANIDDQISALETKLLDYKKVITPLNLMGVSGSLKLSNISAEVWVNDGFPISDRLQPPKINKHTKIRLGYFSGDFKNHPVGLLTAELFELHDRNRFELYAFSLTKAPKFDPLRHRIKGGFDKFIDVEEKSSLEIAQLARSLEIDIAIDLGGHTQHAPTAIMAHRAAPIQVNYLGYPGTMGAEYMDYIVADPVLIPASARQFYVEKVAYLPDSYMVDDSGRLPSQKVFSRKECELPETGFVFCCLNNSYKFNKKIIESWARILTSAKDSVLWISDNNDMFKKNISEEFANLGIDNNRIIFAKRVDLMSDHLARYKLADLFLDTCPYNAHTTAMDALKSGIPVLTILGQTFASRVGGSLLRAIGLPELVTESLIEYEMLAIELAKSPQKIKYFKNRLKENQNKEALFNTKLYVKNIEAAYIEMYRRYEEGAPLDHIVV